MKTNIKSLLTKTILGTSALMLTGLFSAVSAAAVIPLSSGIQYQYYMVDWCSPHWNALQNTWGSACRTGYFQNIGWVAKIVYDGKDYPVWNVQASTAIPSSSTNTADTFANVTKVIDLFSGVTGGAFAMEGEGVIRISVVLIDYAENASRYNITYKIDKTAPQLTLNGFTTSNQYTYYGGRVNASQIVNKNDSVNDISTGDYYANPAMGWYMGSSAASRPNHLRDNLQSFYFRDTNSGVGANSPFSANVSYSDTYNAYLDSNGAMSDGSPSGSLTSGENKFQLLTSDSIQQWGDIPAATSLTLSTANLVSNGPNSQQKYRLRLYDNTVDASGLMNSGNYSETAFYAVRDNTPPNLGGNGLAVDATGAVESVLKFPDNDTVYDTTTPAYNPASSGYSRFFAANDVQLLNYMLNDTGITGQWSISGVGCTDYKLCNAGIDITNTKINIETAVAPTSQALYYQPADRFVNQGSKIKDFSRSDNANLASNETYRYYTAQFLNSGNPQLCDLVGNCITPQLKFRVVANTLNDAKSNASLSTQSDSSGKMMANGLDTYKFTYALRDAYDNKVIPVRSVENAIDIKSVNTQTRFLNGLAEDQRTKFPTGDKHVNVTDKEADNLAVDVSAINASGSLLMQEDVSKKPNGNFALTFSSRVPSAGFYPYLSSNSTLKLQSIDNSANGNAPTGITYPHTGVSRIGYFPVTSTVAGSANGLVVPNTGNLGESGGFNNISVDALNYGTYAYSSASNVRFDDLPNRKVSLEYASPYLYGLIGFKTLIDGQYIQHYKKLYTIATTGGVNTPTVYERNLVAYNWDQDEQPDVLNFDIRQTGTSSNLRYNSGAAFPSLSDATFFSGVSSKNFDIAGATGSGYSAEVQMSAIPGRIYDRAKLRTAFVSGITYNIGTTLVKLPSVARNINDASKVSLDQFSMAQNYYSSTYTIGPVSPSLQASMITDIAVTGLTNRYNAITTDVDGSKANSNVSTELSRPNLIATIKKNVATQSAGFAPAGSASPGVKQWCSWMTINQAFIDNGSTDCTISINGEDVSFIDGNSTLDCGWSDCRVSKKRSIIVQNGYLNIKSNISTLDASKNQTAGQFFLGVINVGGLDNITIDGKDPDILNGKKGWMFVHPSVTNLDAFLLAQGPVTSFDGTKFFTASLTTENQLRNQLHIMGSLLSLSNIGGSRKVTPECPYILGNCNAETAQMFDLVYLRRFVLTSKAQFTNDPLDINIFAPYHPDGLNIAKPSGGKTGDEPADPANCVSNTGLRCITDKDYRAYPMLIERDTRWNSNPSVFFQSN